MLTQFCILVLDLLRGPMFKGLLHRVIRRSAMVLILMQLGLGLSIYGLAALSQHAEIYGTPIWYALLWSAILLYGSFMLGIFYLLWPVYSVYRKIQELLRWRDWILTELPRVIAMIPALIQALREGFEGVRPKPNDQTSPKVDEV